MTLDVYLSGQTHSDWREVIVAAACDLNAAISSPVMAATLAMAVRPEQVAISFATC